MEHDSADGQGVKVQRGNREIREKGLDTDWTEQGKKCVLHPRCKKRFVACAGASALNVRFCRYLVLQQRLVYKLLFSTLKYVLVS